MSNSNKVVLERHLDSLAAAISAEITIHSGSGGGSGGNYADFTGATSIAGGTNGLVPAPGVGAENYFLRGDGNWASIAGGESSAAYVLSDHISSIEGGVWTEKLDGASCLRLRSGNYIYNFAYDTATTVVEGAGSSVATVEPNTYFLGTTPVSSEGGLWYEASDLPKIKYRSGVFAYSLNPDSMTYAGNDTSLVSYLPCFFSPTLDACGQSWVATGSPTIKDSPSGTSKALYIDTNSYLTLNGLALGGQDFTIDAWFYILGGGRNMRTIELWKNSSVEFQILAGSASGNWEQTDNVPMQLNEWLHVAAVYNNSTGKIKSYLNGSEVKSFDMPALKTRLTLDNVFIGESRWHNSESRINAYVSRVRIFDGIARWTSDFTPPTASDYL